MIFLEQWETNEVLNRIIFHKFIIMYNYRYGHSYFKYSDSAAEFQTLLLPDIYQTWELLCILSA